MRRHLSSWLLAAAGGLLLSTAATASDQSTEGVVRLGNAGTSATIPGSAQQVGFHGGHIGGCGTAACGSGYGTAYGCPPVCETYSGCPVECGYGACDPCGCGHGNCKLCEALHCLRCRPVGGCHYSPDHGWAPPGKHPRPRVAATYRRWFPPAWTGETAYGDAGYRYPMVYTPTDTTQLGYYHQRVPVWQHRAGMIPPVPHPDQFHVPNFGVCCNGGIDAALCGHYGGVVGDWVDSGYPADYPESGPPTESAPIETPSAPATVPAPEQKEAAPPYVPPAPAPAPEAPPAAGAGAPGLEKSALAPFLFPAPQR